jgi:hypothetical protein
MLPRLRQSQRHPLPDLDARRIRIPEVLHRILELVDRRVDVLAIELAARELCQLLRVLVIAIVDKCNIQTWARFS